MDKDEIDVKPSLFDKIKNIFKPAPKALPGNDFVPLKKTNMSFGTWNLMYNVRSSITDTLEKISNGFSNLVKPKEPKITNGLKTVTYSQGKEETIKEADTKTGEDAERAGSDDSPIKNIIILGQARTKPVQAQPSLIVESVTVDKEALKEAEELDRNDIDEIAQEPKEVITHSAPAQTTTIAGMEQGEILTDNKAKDSKESREDDAFEK